MAYDPKIADAVLSAMEDDGQSLRQAALQAGTKASTFLGWVDSDNNLAERYARARQALIDYREDELREGVLAPVPTTANGSLDSAAVAEKRLIWDARRWHLSKLAPQKFGDRIDHVSTDGSMTPKPMLDTSKLSEKTMAEILAASDAANPRT